LVSQTEPAVAGLELRSLEPWIREHVASIQPPLRAELIAGGHSNLTYRITDATGAKFVLRRPPLGNLPARAHDVVREARIMAALAATHVPVPKIEAICEAHEVIGAPFYLMRWVDGAIVDSPAGVERVWPTSAQRERAAESLIDALADLHSVNIDTVGLGHLGKREEYLLRQLERMQKVWQKTKTRERPIIETLHARLSHARPPQRYTGIVHSDYRLGNVIIGADEQVAAVLDWELCALGDVMVDLGFLINNWDEPADSAPSIWMQEAPTRAGGFPSRADVVARYARKTGFEIADLDYYRAFAYWRIAIIGEGIKRRYETGALGENRADIHAIDTRVRGRAALADHFLSVWESESRNPKAST